jgi:CRP-like cAMP-binding protein
MQSMQSSGMNNKESFQQFIKDSISATPEMLEQITAAFEEITIPRNSFFLKAGVYANYYMFLNSGFLRAYTFDQDSNEVTTGFYSGPSVVFEVYSFFNRSISRENIQALADSEGLVVTFEKLNQLFHSLPAFREFGRAILVKGFTALKYRTLSMINETAEERYAGLMKSDPEVFQYAPLKDIASYLGITNTSLSRIRKKFITK